LAKKVYLLEQKTTLNISEAEVLGFEIGLAVGHRGLLGKQNQYDHSVRAPFIIA
jgi:choline-sulfatase